MSGTEPDAPLRTLDVERAGGIVTLTFRCRDEREAIRLYDEITESADDGTLTVNLIGSMQ